MASNILPPALKRLVDNLSKLPGIGEKTATRLALFILRGSEQQAQELAKSILEIHKSIKLCSICFTFSDQDPCPICSNPKRDKSIVCVVEEPGDLLAMEKAGEFKGRYHVLHGVLSPRDGIGPEELRLSQLKNRIERENIKELIIATSPTMAGEATAAYISKMLSKMNITITRIACGVPMGMDIKYADPVTLKKALEARRPI